MVKVKVNWFMFIMGLALSSCGNYQESKLDQEFSPIESNNVMKSYNLTISEIKDQTIHLDKTALIPFKLTRNGAIPINNPPFKAMFKLKGLTITGSDPTLLEKYDVNCTQDPINKKNFDCTLTIIPNLSAIYGKTSNQVQLELSATDNLRNQSKSMVFKLISTNNYPKIINLTSNLSLSSPFFDVQLFDKAAQTIDPDNDSIKIDQIITLNPNIDVSILGDLVKIREFRSDLIMSPAGVIVSIVDSGGLKAYQPVYFDIKPVILNISLPSTINKGEIVHSYMYCFDQNGFDNLSNVVFGINNGNGEVRNINLSQLKTNGRVDFDIYGAGRGEFEIKYQVLDDKHVYITPYASRIVVK